MKTTATTILIASTLLLATPACTPMIASLDVSVDAVRLALTSGNHAGLRAISHPDLAKGITPTKLASVAREIARYGEFKERKFRSFKTEQNGPLRAHYLLVYEKVNVDLKIALLEGKLVYLKFKAKPRA